MSYPEFDRNMKVKGHDQDAVDRTSVVVAGANPTSEAIVSQLLALGFRDIYLWDRDSARVMKSLSHISPLYRGKTSIESLEAHALVGGLDSLAFRKLSSIHPGVFVNTINDELVSDTLMSMRHQGLYMDAHTVSDHESKRYGLRISTLPSDWENTHDLIEGRSLEAFDNKVHDRLMALICASYASAMIMRYVNKDNFFDEPREFSLFPFSDVPEGESAVEVHYPGFFMGKGLYLAGLGGGSVVLDALVNIFNIDRIQTVDYDKLERSNWNRLLHLIDDRFLGMKKTEAHRLLYGRQGLEYNDAMITDKLSGDASSIDIIISALSGFDNKHNLVALSQGIEKPHMLVDIGTEPYRVDITSYVDGDTPCDYCRNLPDLALVEYISQNVPNCALSPHGSYVFSTQLGVLAIIEAMKYIRPELGEYAKGSITCNLLGAPESLYLINDASSIADCRSHRTTSPLDFSRISYEIKEAMQDGWQVKQVLKGGKLAGVIK